jgi:tetraacyldisaccharide 4'-kinase
LLREPPAGLRRADAIVVTHASEAGRQQLAAITTMVRRYNAEAPLFLTSHCLTGLLSQDSTILAMSGLAERKYLVACGIGEPESFADALLQFGKRCVGRHFFSDHHHFTNQDVIALRRQASHALASAIIVTEKDWTKLRDLPAVRDPGIPFFRAQLSIQFEDGGAEKLLELVWQRTGH